MSNTKQSHPLETGCNKKKIPKHLTIYESPIRLLLLITGTLFITHTFAMVMFALLPQFPMWTESIIESFLLLILLFPALYFFSLRPLLKHITERDRAEEVMRESEHKYRQLFENLTDAIFLIDVESGRILDANKQAELLLGYNRNEIMGTNQTKLYPPEKSEESLQCLMRLARHEGTSDYTTEIIDRTGKVLLVQIRGTPLVLFGRNLVLELFREINASSHTASNNSHASKKF